MSKRVEHFDVVIFGAGFGGSLMAMILARLGYSVLLLEKGSHPRFAIGESSTPFANLLLEQLADRYELPAVRPLCEWGTWQRSKPELPVGLKRGFTFYHHAPGKPMDFADRTGQLLVAASPHEEVADTHWYRPVFDQFLVQEAEAAGVIYRDQVTITKIEQKGSWHIEFSRGTENSSVEAAFAIDATGPNGVLARVLEIESVGFKCLPQTQALYAHFQAIPRLEALHASLRSPSLPYPPDDAAVHHVFAGGWIWVLRFNNGITSAGAALESGLAQELGVSRGNEAAAWKRLVARFPTLEAAFAAAERITPFHFASELSFRRARAAGENWALLPSSAGFVDPLLSTGFALTLLGIQRLAGIVEKGPSAQAFREYEQATFLELDTTAELISALYSKMAAPEEFNRLTLLYFAAMSFTETAWRLNKRELATGFLLSSDQQYRARIFEFCHLARAGETVHRHLLENMIQPYDVAGLSNWQWGNWYPVCFEELRAHAGKLGATRSEVEELIAKTSARCTEKQALSTVRAACETNASK
jgi:FADH2 O2-dependent halogenase